jgi:hypothetical protein
MLQRLVARVYNTVLKMQVAGRTIHAHLTLVESGVSKLQACLMLKTITSEVWISGISSLFFKRLQ